MKPSIFCHLLAAAVAYAATAKVEDENPPLAAELAYNQLSGRVLLQADSDPTSTTVK